MTPPAQNCGARKIPWRELPADDPLPLVRRRQIVGEQAMLSHIELGAGCDVPVHQHENEQFACVLSGRVRFTLGAASSTYEEIVSAGEVLHIPANVPHGAAALEDALVLDVFAPPSEETGLDSASGG